MARRISKHSLQYGLGEVQVSDVLRSFEFSQRTLSEITSFVSDGGALRGLSPCGDNLDAAQCVAGDGANDK